MQPKKLVPKKPQKPGFAAKDAKASAIIKDAAKAGEVGATDSGGVAAAKPTIALPPGAGKKSAVPKNLLDVKKKGVGLPKAPKTAASVIPSTSAGPPPLKPQVSGLPPLTPKATSPVQTPKKALNQKTLVRFKSTSPSAAKGSIEQEDEDPSLQGGPAPLALLSAFYRASLEEKHIQRSLGFKNRDDVNCFVSRDKLLAWSEDLGAWRKQLNQFAIPPDVSSEAFLRYIETNLDPASLTRQNMKQLEEGIQAEHFHTKVQNGRFQEVNVSLRLEIGRMYIANRTNVYGVDIASYTSSRQGEECVASIDIPSLADKVSFLSHLRTLYIQFTTKRTLLRPLKYFVLLVFKCQNDCDAVLRVLEVLALRRRIKAGFAGLDSPSIVMPSVVGYAKYHKAISEYPPSHLSENASPPLSNSNSRPFAVGKKACQLRGILRLDYPIEEGIIKDYDAMELLWSHLFNKRLKVSPNDHKVLLTEIPFIPFKARAQMVEIMLEKFNVEAVAVQTQAVLTLYASGRTSGLVLDSGDGVTHALAVVEGFSIAPSIKRVPLAGRHLTSYLGKLLAQSGGACLQTSAETDLVRELKEKYCYVAENFEAQIKLLQKSKQQTPTLLPDGTPIDLNGIDFQCPEALFRPSLIDQEGDGVAGLLATCLKQCDLDLRRQLLSNIVLSGGTTSLRGFPERLAAELDSKIAIVAKPPIKVIAPKGRQYFVWVGGSILASSEAFQNQWVTKADIEERGASAFLQAHNHHSMMRQ